MRALLMGVLLSALAVDAQTGAAGGDKARERALDRYRAGQAALLGEAFDRAEAEFKEAIRLDPLLVPAHYGLGQAYMAMKAYPRAVQAYAGCRQAFHDQQAGGLMNAIEWEKRLRDQIRAMEDQVRLLQTGRLQAGTGGAATTQSAMQRIQDQIGILKGLQQTGPRQAEPTPPSISLALGSAYFRSSALEDAEREYKAALAVDSNLGEAHNNLAVVYMLTGRLDLARKELDLAEKAGFQVSPGLRRDLETRLPGRRP
jgi:tetratricopeptide (TPR) repeat protein